MNIDREEKKWDYEIKKSRTIDGTRTICVCYKKEISDNVIVLSISIDWANSMIMDQYNFGLTFWDEQYREKKIEYERKLGWFTWTVKFTFDKMILVLILNKK